MGEFSILTIKLLFLFLPGIIFCLVYERITFHTKIQDNLKIFSVHAFVWSIILYYLYTKFSSNEVYFLKDLLNTNSNTLHINEIYSVSILSLALAIFAAWIKNQHIFENFRTKSFWLNFINKHEKKILKFNITYYTLDVHYLFQILNPFKICQGDVWSNIFNTEDNDMKWVIIHDGLLNLIYEGWVYKYSDTYKENEIFIRDVIVFNQEYKELRRISGLYITRNSENLTIEFPTLKSTGAINRYKENKNEQRKTKK